MKYLGQIISFSFVIILFLISNINSNTPNTTEKLYINMIINKDGSISVQELANLKGQYNGRIRTLYYGNQNLPQFTGKTEDFESSNLYNSKKITNIRVFEVDNANKMNFSDLRNNIKQYSLVDSASNGQSGVYEKEILDNGWLLKVYNPSSRNKGFYLDYIIEDAVVVHEDVAEFYYDILGKSYEENIEKLRVKITLPEENSFLSSWLRGPTEGSLVQIDNNTVEIEYQKLPANTGIVTRLMFDKEVVPASTKLTHMYASEKIMRVEENLKEIHDTEIRNETNRINKVKLYTWIYYIIIGTALLLFWILRKADYYEADFDFDYYRELPDNYGPEVLEYLLTKKVTDKGLSASILNLVDKGVLRFYEDTSKNNDIILIKCDYNESILSESEKMLVNFLINQIGTGKAVNFSNLANYLRGSNNEYNVATFYRNWQRKVTKEGKEHNFFIGLSYFAILILLFAVFGVMLLSHISKGFHYLPLYATPFFTLAIGLMLVQLKYRSPKGILHYKQWKAFGKFLDDFGQMNEKEFIEVNIWQKYLVYGSILRKTKVVEEQMAKRLDLFTGATSNWGLTSKQLIRVQNDISKQTHGVIRSSTSILKVTKPSTLASPSSNSRSNSSGGGFTGGGGGSSGSGGGGGRF